MKALSQEQVDSYRYNGFLFPLPALSADNLPQADRIRIDAYVCLYVTATALLSGVFAGLLITFIKLSWPTGGVLVPVRLRDGEGGTLGRPT